MEKNGGNEGNLTGPKPPVKRNAPKTLFIFQTI